MNIDDIIQSALEINDAERLAELERQIFVKGKESIAPFAPMLELADGAVERFGLAPAEEPLNAGFEDLRSVAIAIANRISKARRRIDYNLKTSGNFNGIRIISEGDSWFQYPVFLHDIVDNLKEDADKAVLSFGGAGDLLCEMSDEQEYLDALRTQDARIFLLSGGGNDLFGDGRLASILHPNIPGGDVDDHIKPAAYRQLMTGIADDYRRTIEQVLSIRPDIHILGHTYDVPVRHDGRWIGAPLKALGIPMELGQRIIVRLLDDFVGVLNALSNEIENFTLVNLRGAVGESRNSWEDEIHPRNAGFERIADLFRDAISKVLHARKPLSAGTQKSVTPTVPKHGIMVANETRILNCTKSDTDQDWSMEDALTSGALTDAEYYADSHDLRAPWWPIGDQGSTGSCVGWAAADSVLRWHFVKQGRIGQNDRLSVRFLWMAAKETDEFNRRPTAFIEQSGTSLKAALDVARKLGVVREQVLPFQSGAVFPGSERSFYTQAAQLKIASYHYLGNNLSNWRRWLYAGGPILTRLQVDATFQNAAGTNGYLDAYGTAAPYGGHAIALVGYDRRGFIVRNSWSEDWGDQGFAFATDAYAQAAFTEAYGVIV